MLKKENIILFVPYKQHLSSLYEGIVKRGCTVGALVHYEHLNSYNFGIVKVISMRILVGYPLILYRWLRIGFQVPRYIVNFRAKVKSFDTKSLVLFDIYHWYFLQALYLKRVDSEIKLYLYCETKRKPNRKVSAWVLTFFLKVMGNYQHLIDGVFVYTNDGENFFAKYIDSQKIYVLPAPVDTKVFTADQDFKKDTDTEPFRILCNARFDHYKNHEHLLCAIASLIENNKNCTLTLIGRAESGKERVEQLVNSMGLSHCVNWVDTLPKNAMPELYRSHDVLVLPSYNEAIGMVVPEAMACGIPTITSDTVGANVYVMSGKTGFIFETGNIKDLVDKLTMYIESPRLRKEHGSAAAKNIELNYTIEKCTDRFLRVLESN